jgi:Uma2 family endonuclease
MSQAPTIRDQPQVPPKLQEFKEDLTLRIPSKAATHAGFREWVTSDDFQERGRFAYIDGEILIDMSPESLENHVKVKFEVSTTLIMLNKELDLGEFYGDGTLISNAEAGVSNEPDATFVTWQSFEAGRATFTPRRDHPGDSLEIVGTPDVVVEVVSVSSVAKDTKLLRTAYDRAGIPEYWLIDAWQADKIQFEIRRHTPEGHVTVEQVEGWLRSEVFGRKFRLERIRNRAGRWQYNLQVAPI